MDDISSFDPTMREKDDCGDTEPLELVAISLEAERAFLMVAMKMQLCATSGCEGGSASNHE